MPLSPSSTRCARLDLAALPLLLALVVCLLVPHAAVGQEDDSASEDGKELSRERVEIEPYTGPPIFLPEGDAPPEPQQVDSRVLKINQPDSEAPFFERRVVLFSDESLKSDGVYKEYFSSGNLFAEGEFRMGRPAGKWTFYHDNGSVAKEVSYLNGRPEGDVETRDADGRLTAKRSYKEGKRHGAWVMYKAESDQPIAEHSYADGKPDGMWRTWFSNGQQRQEVSFREGQRNGIAKEWTSDGKPRLQAEFKDDKQHGLTKVWQRDGRVIERRYNEGELVSSESDE